MPREAGFKPASVNSLYLKDWKVCNPINSEHRKLMPHQAQAQKFGAYGRARESHLGDCFCCGLAFVRVSGMFEMSHSWECYCTSSSLLDAAFERLRQTQLRQSSLCGVE
ncbi:hypothetical protein Salat_2552100 [Sesamum alatum]|uniref:Uncharacterized protein n=1 Tax=Sesamum alatum TaxID=300844 RepID=A0AAE1XSQ4_9LAMI|nr:hypothetical protein Salat_2552100 [Sesamum alatum]